MGRRITKWTPERIDKVRELVSEGIPDKEIARMFGVNPVALRKMRHVHKIPRTGVKLKNGKLTSQGKLEGALRDIYEEQKKLDLATRIRILKGEEIRKTEPKYGFTDDQIERWIPSGGVKACDLFCKEVLNVELQDYQLEMVDKMLNHKRCVFILGRQTGKDFTISCFVIWLCITNSSQRVLLVSPAQRQSDLLFNRILTFIASNNELFDSVEKSNMEQCRFTNNSEVHNLPSTAFIRGFTEVTHIFVNESAHGISDETIHAVLEPMLAIRKGFLYLFSTPTGCMGVTWDAFNSPVYAKMQLSSHVNKYIDRGWLEQQKQRMPAVVYDCRSMRISPRSWITSSPWS